MDLNETRQGLGPRAPAIQMAFQPADELHGETGSVKRDEQSKGAFPTHKHCLQFRQILPSNRLIVCPADGPGHVAFVTHGKTPGGPTVFHAGSFPDQHPGMHPPAKPLPPLRIARGVPWNFRQREGFSREFLLAGALSTEPFEEAT